MESKSRSSRRRLYGRYPALLATGRVTPGNAPDTYEHRFSYQYSRRSTTYYPHANSYFYDGKNWNLLSIGIFFRG